MIVEAFGKAKLSQDGAKIEIGCDERRGRVFAYADGELVAEKDDDWPLGTLRWDGKLWHAECRKVSCEQYSMKNLGTFSSLHEAMAEILEESKPPKLWEFTLTLCYPGRTPDEAWDEAFEDICNDPKQLFGKTPDFELIDDWYDL
jgi:hypothetical protein